MDYEDMLMQESYYGKLPEFESIEKNLASVMKKIQDDYDSKKMKLNPNKLKEMKEIEKMFCKIFGFRKSFIYWEAFSAENAYTYSMNTFIIFTNKKNIIKRDNKGYYDTSHENVLTVYISTSLVTLTKMTPRELLACILHEIGHNFDYSAYHRISYMIDNLFSLGESFFLRTTEMKTTEDISNIKIAINDEIKGDNDKIYNNSKKRKKMVENFLYQMKKAKVAQAIVNMVLPLYGMFTQVGAVIISPISQLFTLTGKSGEVFADSFAAAYGYGTELITALEKIEDPKKYYNPKNKIISFFQSLGEYQTETLIAMCDVHGSNLERCNYVRKKLKKDLRRSDFSPELKAELEKEIANIDETLKKLRSFEPEEKFRMKKMWRKLVHFIFRDNVNILQKLFRFNQV